MKAIEKVQAAAKRKGWSKDQIIQILCKYIDTPEPFHFPLFLDEQPDSSTHERKS